MPEGLKKMALHTCNICRIQSWIQLSNLWMLSSYTGLPHQLYGCSYSNCSSQVGLKALCFLTFWWRFRIITFFWWIISGNRGFFFRTMSDIFPFLSLLVGLSTNFMTWYRLWPLPNYEWFPWIICNGCDMPAGNAFPSGHLVPSPILGLACRPIVETRFLELAMSLLNFSPRIPIGTFSILLVRKKIYCDRSL